MFTSACSSLLITSLFTRSSLPRCLPVVFTSVLYNHLYLSLFTSVLTSRIYPGVYLSSSLGGLPIVFTSCLPVVISHIFINRPDLGLLFTGVFTSHVYLGVYRSWIARPLQDVLTSVFSSRSKTASMLFWWLFHRSENTCSNIIFLHALITFLSNLHIDRHDYLVLELQYRDIELQIRNAFFVFVRKARSFIEKG